MVLFSAFVTTHVYVWANLFCTGHFSFLLWWRCKGSRTTFFIRLVFIMCKEWYGRWVGWRLNRWIKGSLFSQSFKFIFGSGWCWKPCPWFLLLLCSTAGSFVLARQSCSTRFWGTCVQKLFFAINAFRERIFCPWERAERCEMRTFFYHNRCVWHQYQYATNYLFWIQLDGKGWAVNSAKFWIGAACRALI